MADELSNPKNECLWLQKKICKIPDGQSCPSDCSLKSLVFQKDSIIKRIMEEDAEVKDLKKHMFRNREKIKDLVMGMFVLQRVLKDSFDYDYVRVVDKEFEKVPNFAKGGWRVPRK